jgi:hypothetical protein
VQASFLPIFFSKLSYLLSFSQRTNQKKKRSLFRNMGESEVYWRPQPLSPGAWTRACGLNEIAKFDSGANLVCHATFRTSQAEAPLELLSYANFVRAWLSCKEHFPLLAVEYTKDKCFSFSSSRIRDYLPNEVCIEDRRGPEHASQTRNSLLNDVDPLSRGGGSLARLLILVSPSACVDNTSSTSRPSWNTHDLFVILSPSIGDATSIASIVRYFFSTLVCSEAPPVPDVSEILPKLVPIEQLAAYSPNAARRRWCVVSSLIFFMEIK